MLILLSVVFFLRSANATTFIPMPFPDLVGGAPTIARGVIGPSHSDWVGGANGSRRIFTFYEFQVEEVFKGEIGGSSVQIRELGGEKDGVGMQISGTAQFAPGEDVVVFLGTKNEDGSYEVRGLSSGKFDLERQPDGKECLSGVALSGDEHERGGEKCAWDIASLRKIVREQSAAPAAANLRTPPVSPPQRSLPTSSPAPGLQPSPLNEVGADAKGQLWKAVLALGIAGLLALFLIKPKR